ncbi:MAG TPA: hypothetical protein VLG12_08530 [Candidatus Saccharimonadales bacterium]|nr:hypothetical protein [Candidatus Saccharimonadales bacterium]
MENEGGIQQNPEQQEKFARLVPEVFTHDPNHPERTEEIVDQVLDIERSRFPEDQAFDREIFEDAFKSTIPTEENKGKTVTVVLVRDPKDGSIFGFTYTEPAEYVYEDSENPDDAFHPERLQNLNLHQTAYISDTVFRESGSGAIKKLMPVLEEQLLTKGYQYIERDSAMANNYAPNLVKNNADRILETEEHDSEYGPQMFIRMKINPSD